MLTLLSAALSEAPRYWPKFSGARTVVTLDGEWSFGLLDRPSAFDSMSPSFSPADAPTPNTTSVPSCFDEAGMGELGVRGVAFYRTTFEHAGRARLQFQAPPRGLTLTLTLTLTLAHNPNPNPNP